MRNLFSPEEQLRKGAEILRELLEPAGFNFAISAVGKGSGGLTIVRPIDRVYQHAI